MKLGIVVLHYTFSEITDNCLQSIRLYAPDTPLLVVDNGSPVPYQSDQPVLRLEQNWSLAAAMNLGTRALLDQNDVDVAFQINNDILITGNTIQEIEKVFVAFPRVGVASPMMDQKDADFAYFPCPFDPGAEAENYLNQSLPKNKNVFLPFVDNAAFAIRRKTWEQVGPLEERFTGASWGANYDYCWRVRSHKWEVVLVKSAFVFHKHRATWSQIDTAYYENSVNRMMAEAQAVWGDLARKVLWRDQSWKDEYLSDKE